MKNFIFVLILFFCISCQYTKNFIPLEIGNYWVYHDTEFNLLDTVRVVDRNALTTGTLFVLNTDRWIESQNGDSIYIQCQSRSSSYFTMPCLQRVNTKTEYSTCYGDVLMQVTAEPYKLALSVSEKYYRKCYRFSIPPLYRIWVSDGIGIIKIEYMDEKQNIVKSRNLVQYKFN